MKQTLMFGACFLMVVAGIAGIALMLRGPIVNGTAATPRVSQNIDTITHDGHLFVIGSIPYGGLVLLHHPECQCLGGDR